MTNPEKYRPGFEAWYRAEYPNASLEQYPFGGYVRDSAADKFRGYLAAKLESEREAERTESKGIRVTVDAGALQLALNVLRRAGKDEVADELEKTRVRYFGTQRQSADAAKDQA